MAATNLLANRAGARVVIVDDDEAIVQFVGDALSMLGHVVEPFTNAIDALDRLVNADASPVDLVITDYRMPGILGDQLAACLREVLPALPIIVLTGFSDANASILPSFQRTTILAKPFAIAQLRRSVDDALR
jgi:two-component system, cell cycle sensor histidine kinase and response regulator CckA